MLVQKLFIMIIFLVTLFSISSFANEHSPYINTQKIDDNLSVDDIRYHDKAFFVTAISLTLNTNHHIIFLGRIDGKVSLEPLGENGFGYDPIFIPVNYKKTFAEMGSKQKNKISHRMIAVTKLQSFLF